MTSLLSNSMRINSGARLYHVFQKRRQLGLALFVSLSLMALVASVALANEQFGPVHSPSAQEYRGMTQQLYLLPAEDTIAQLQTHKVSVTVHDNNDGTVSAFINALYQVKNESEDPITLSLLLYYGIGDELPQEISLSGDGIPLSLSSNEDGELVSEVRVPADSRVMLGLNYAIVVDETKLATIRYAPGVLRRWRGPTSTRIEYYMPSSIPRESWTTVQPDGWSYATATAETTAIKWLYDSLVPDDEFIVQFIMPREWQRIDLTQAVAAAGAPIDTYLSLGNSYRELANAETVDESLVQWFTSQAVAAYTDGLQRGTGASPDTRAKLHIGLASIYRDRVTSPGVDVVASSLMMVDESAAALAFLPSDSAQRSELQQWLADGLRVLFDDARASGNWQRASEIMDEMSGLPPGAVDSRLVEEGRQIVLAQQALQLMRRGEQAAAEALVGESVDDELISTPVEYTPLFDAWRLTATAYPDNMALTVDAMPASDRQEQALQKLTELQTSWATQLESAGKRADVWAMSEVIPAPSGALHLEFTAETDRGTSLTHFVPNDLDFILLRTVLDQLGPIELTDAGMLQSDSMRSQYIDLRPAGQQLEAIAAELERAANDLNTLDESASPVERLVAEMQAAEYRNTADEWRAVARDSWLLFEFNEPSSPEQNRSWFATAVSEPANYIVNSQVINNSRLMAGFFSLLILVGGLTGLVWWLV